MELRIIHPSDAPDTGRPPERGAALGRPRRRAAPVQGVVRHAIGPVQSLCVYRYRGRQSPTAAALQRGAVCRVARLRAVLRALRAVAGRVVLSH